MKLIRNVMVTVLVLAAVVATGASAAAQTESILYTFGGSPDATEPRGGLVADAAGNFYGSAYSGGVYGAGAVYKLSPSAVAGGTWIETVIYSFNNVTGDFPLGNLAVDRQGNLFGTTSYGGDPTCLCGTVFKLKAPAVAGGTSSFRNLHSFTKTSGDGAYPQVGVVLDSKGSVYGTATQGGANGMGMAYKIASAGNGFVETILLSFDLTTRGYSGPLIFDATGNLYGAALNGGTYGRGSVIELSPPASGTGSWSVTVLTTFRAGTSTGYYPDGPLIQDAQGQLYGTNMSGGRLNGGQAGAGTIFRLTPPVSAGGPWTVSTLYSFTGGSDAATPFSGLTLSRQTGVFYGITGNGANYTGCGVIFQLVPPAIAGGQWTESTFHTFVQSPDGCYPSSSPTLDAAGNLFGATFEGGGIANSGVVYEVVP